MNALPPLMRDQRKIDAGHLKLLAIFHFLLAALSVVGLGFLFLHWFFLHTIFTNPEIFKHQHGGPPPAEFMAIFKWFYLFFGTLIIGVGLANLLSGWLILKRRARLASLVIAGVDCLAFPFGTALGVFTIIVLLRESVLELYEFPAAPTAAANPSRGGSG